MADGGSHGLGFRLDIKQILLEAQHRWLRPAEICEILRNYQKFQISPEAPNNPVSGSTFLFDRKALRYFRKDGHNWRKKKDGKTVKEAHEKLKVGRIDMLHCYYAHGEVDENFQRRSYWLLEEDLMHIVFVHYLIIKGGKTNSFIRNADATLSKSENDSFPSYNFQGASTTSTLSSNNEDAEAEDNQQASSSFHSYPESSLIDESHPVLSNYNMQSCRGEIAYKQEFGTYPLTLPNLQHSFTDHSFGLQNAIMNRNMMLNFPNDPGSKLFEQRSLFPNKESNMELFYDGPGDHKGQSEEIMLSGMETTSAAHQNSENVAKIIGNENYSIVLKKPTLSSLQKGEDLKKNDSFSKWMANELGEAEELGMPYSNRLSWSIMDNEYDSNMSAHLEVDADSLSPSILGDQLFSIIDFSPNWAYSIWETKVLVTGTFLRNEQLSKCRWSIMFGEIEIPAEVLADGILSSYAPPHDPGLVPFYVTCSNRLACSEIREFEYRCRPEQNTGVLDVNRDYSHVMHLYQRFEMLMSQRYIHNVISSIEDACEKQNIVKDVVSLMEKNYQEAKLISRKDISQPMVLGELLLEEQLKEKFYSWLVCIVTEVGMRPMVVDEGGQGVLHVAAALGFIWALQPIIISGVSIDFRDVNGWTALHWAAFYGREDTVAALVSLGASPGALTDPSADYPLGRTPADLASSSGHKGISGFLAETYLTTHVSTLQMNDQQEDGMAEVSGVKTIHTVSERLAVPTVSEIRPDTLPLKDSLAAIRNASQAAARIQQFFRIQSFQRKKLLGQGGYELPTSDEQAISLVAGKTSRFGLPDGMSNTAALQIQKRFRGWKKRKEFLLIRQKVVKIQAHVRGHQVRMKQKSISWSVGVLEKLILRWRRRGRGFRGFGSDLPDTHGALAQGDDYDVLRQGRRQTEERMEKALSRVKSMAHYPEARDQYRRLLTAAQEFRETQAAIEEAPDNINDTGYPDDELFDLETLLDDDTFMSLAFQ